MDGDGVPLTAFSVKMPICAIPVILGLLNSVVCAVIITGIRIKAIVMIFFISGLVDVRCFQYQIYEKNTKFVVCK